MISEQKNIADSSASMEAMQCCVQPFVKFYYGDGVAGMATIKSNSVKCVLTDPPYLYLKGQKLEREFDEWLYFKKVRRVLSNDGFIILFGRGSSFYRWNNILDQMGFVFKEEIIWNKTYNSSPVTPINRVHETISIYSKKNGSLNLSFVPYTKMKTDIGSIHQDIKRIKSALNNKVEFDDLCKYLETGLVDYKPENRTLGNNTTVQTAMSQQSRGVKTMQAINRGLKEKSIIDENRDHFETIHPTQKPISLLKRLLALTTTKGDLVIDNFSGSCSTGIACQEMEREFIGWEIDNEYYEKSVARISKNVVQLGMF